MTDPISLAVTAYVNRLKELTTDAVVLQPGRRYLKIVTINQNNSSRVHSFIEKTTGDLYKAATYKAPAKGARFNLVTQLDTVLSIADIYGSFLYKN